MKTGIIIYISYKSDIISRMSAKADCTKSNR